VSGATVARVRLIGGALGLAALAGVAIGLLLAAVPGGAQGEIGLPKMHGQASWSPGQERAPSFSLRDQNGSRVSLTSLGHHPVLITFLDSQCHEQCPIQGRQLGIMLRQMAPATRPTVVVVGVNPAGDTPASIRHAMREWGLAGPWRWHWLRGAQAELAPVWRAYGITVIPTTNDITHGMALFLVDRRGFERAGYLFPFLPNFVALDLKALARERT
jgi:cytochrome oxidase Cu insertion factor (SCO1/SenC/PrrC family)